jgi:hypothetical protein
MNMFNLELAGSALIGAGIAKLDDVRIGLLLIGVGVLILVGKAILNKFGIPVAR